MTHRWPSRMTMAHVNEAVLSKGQKRIKMPYDPGFISWQLWFHHRWVVEWPRVRIQPTRSEVEAPKMGIYSEIVTMVEEGRGFYLQTLRPCFKLGNQAVSLHEFIMDSAEVSCLETCPAISPLASSKRHPPTFGEQTSPPKASFPQQNEAIRTISTLQ
jgi:hypothetical protein